MNAFNFDLQVCSCLMGKVIRFFFCIQLNDGLGGTLTWIWAPLSTGPDRICASPGCSCNENLPTSCGENETMFNKKQQHKKCQHCRMKRRGGSQGWTTTGTSSRQTDWHTIRLNFYARWNIQKMYAAKTVKSFGELTKKGTSPQVLEENFHSE